MQQIIDDDYQGIKPKPLPISFLDEEVYEVIQPKTNSKSVYFMTRKTHHFIESSYPSDRFNKLPIIPITLEGYPNIIKGFVDTGATITHIDTNLAVAINAIVIDNAFTQTIVGIQNLPVCNVGLTTEAMNGIIHKLDVIISDNGHPDIHILLGRDFLDLFNKIEYDGKNKTITLDY